MGIVWIKKENRNNCHVNHDVFVSTCRAGRRTNGNERRNNMRISFSDDAALKIAAKAEFCVFGFDAEKNRVYFAPFASDEGYKLRKSSANRYVISRYLRPGEERVWEARAGGYDLKFDTKNAMYYIDIACAEK